MGILFPMVEVTGFEPAASSSRTKRSTKLSHTSIAFHSECPIIIAQNCRQVKYYFS